MDLDKKFDSDLEAEFVLALFLELESLTEEVYSLVFLQQLGLMSVEELFLELYLDFEWGYR